MEEAPGKVISITTREEIEPAINPYVPVEEKQDDYDVDTALAFQEFAKEAREGRYTGCLILGWDAKEMKFISELILPENERPDVSATMMLGYLETVKLALADIVTTEQMEE